MGTRTTIDFELADFPDGPVRALYVRRRGRDAILIDRALDPVDRLAALAHELVHRERNGGAHHPDAPASWAPVVAREERRVDGIVAGRLVPPERLADLIRQRADLEAITPAFVAAEFDVPTHVAHRALTLLDEQQTHRRMTA
jgi:hypothetical protein